MAALSEIKVRITGDSASLTKAIKDSASRMQKFKGAASKAFGAVKASALALGTAGVGAVVGLGAAVLASVGNFTKMGDEIHKMALRTGFSTEALSKLKFAAEQTGADIGGIEKAIRRMHGTILDANNGMASASDSLDQIGLSASDLKGLAPEEQFRLMAQGLSNVADKSTQAALAEDIFGRAGNQLLPLLKTGTEEMDKLGAQAEKLGIVFSQDAANAAADLTDAQNELKSALAGAGNSIAQGLVPHLATFLRSIVDLKAKLQPLIDLWRDHFMKILKAIVPILRDEFGKTIAWLNKEILPRLVKIFKENIMPIIRQFGEWWKTNGPAITTAVKLIAGGIRNGLVVALDLLKPVLNVLTWVLGKVMLPILGFLVTGIANVVIAISEWRTIFAEVSNFVKGVINGAVSFILEKLIALVDNPVIRFLGQKMFGDTFTEGIDEAKRIVDEGLLEIKDITTTKIDTVWIPAVDTGMVMMAQSMTTGMVRRGRCSGHRHGHRGRAVSFRRRYNHWNHLAQLVTAG